MRGGGVKEGRALLLSVLSSKRLETEVENWSVLVGKEVFLGIIIGQNYRYRSSRNLWSKRRPSSFISLLYYYYTLSAYRNEWIEDIYEDM